MYHSVRIIVFLCDKRSNCELFYTIGKVFISTQFFASCSLFKTTFSVRNLHISNYLLRYRFLFHFSQNTFSCNFPNRKYGKRRLLAFVWKRLDIRCLASITIAKWKKEKKVTSYLTSKTTSPTDNIWNENLLGLCV